MSNRNQSSNDIHEVYPYLCVSDAVAAAEYYAQAFGATELFRLTEPSGRVGHLEMSLGPITLMLSEEFPEYGITGPSGQGNNAFTIHLHVDNADTVAERAVKAGGTMIMELADQFYGERSCRVRDPFGHVWLIGHQIEKVSVEEMQSRYNALFTGDGS